MIITKIKDIKIKINCLLIIVFMVYFFTGYLVEGIIIFSTILIHELAHALAALKVGIKTKEIELFFFGGVAKFDDFIGTNPKNEIIISIIGPLTNILLVVFFFIVRKYWVNTYIIGYLHKINLYLAVFNLLPLLPLDGGRIIRALLSHTMSYKIATKKSILITYIVSIGMIFYGVYSYLYGENRLYIILFAIFVVVAAKKEEKMAAFTFIKEITGKKDKLLKKGVMKAHFLIGLNTITAKTVLNNLLPKRYHIIIVIDCNSKHLGTIYEEELINGIIKYGIDVTLEKLLINNEK